MNIVFAVQNNDDWNSKVNLRFGRAEGFILYSEETEKLTYYSNDNIQASHGAGTQAGQLLSNLKANVLITGGSIGPKALKVLTSAEVELITNVGEISIKEAFANYKK